MTVKFHPSQATVTESVLAVHVNDAYTIDVPIRGEAIPLNLCSSPSMLKFGTLRPLQTETRIFKLYNKSPIPVTLSLKPSLQLLEYRNLRFSSAKNLTIPGRDVRECTLTYAPSSPMEPFEETCIWDVEGASRGLFKFSGACKGADLQLSRSSVDFGRVSQGCTKTEAVLVKNIGEQECTFTWSSNRNMFRVDPLQGRLTPKQKSSFWIQYKPRTVSTGTETGILTCTTSGKCHRQQWYSQGCVSEGEVYCIEVTGICEACVLHEEILDFNCPAGSSVKKKLEISNPTEEPWKDIHVLFSNPLWSVQHCPDLDPHQSSEMEIEFSPSKQDSEDIECLMTVQYPNGKGKHFKLIGKIEAGQKLQMIQRHVLVRDKHIECITVVNPFSSLQHYRVNIDRSNCPDTSIIEVTYDTQFPDSGEFCRGQKLWTSLH